MYSMYRLIQLCLRLLETDMSPKKERVCMGVCFTFYSQPVCVQVSDVTTVWAPVLCCPKILAVSR